MICPLMSLRDDNYHQCLEKQCAFWDEYDKCSIKTIAKNLDYVVDVCEGARTLLVKEV